MPFLLGKKPTLIDAYRETALGTAQLNRELEAKLESERAIMDDLLTQRDDLLALIEQVEWCEMPGLRCPWCEESIDDGHAKGCPRQAAIDTVRAAEEAR